MVCPRCIKVVETTVSKMGFEVTSIKLGEVVVDKSLNEKEQTSISEALQAWGFELIENREEKLVSQIKGIVVQMIHYAEELPDIKNSAFLSEKIGLSYDYISKIFSTHEQITIEKYIILQKIERVKELLSYKELALKEIAYQLGYKSVQHLSSQFRSVVGMSVTEFKKLEQKGRKTLDF